MKRIVIILIGLISVAYGQSSPTSSKTRFVNGLYVGTKLDSYFSAADSNAIYWRADSVVMAKYKGTARALAFAVSGGYLPISDTAAMLSKYLRRTDSTGLLSQVVRTFGTQTVGGNKTFSGVTSISDVTASSSPTTGSLIVGGGIGVGSTGINGVRIHMGAANEPNSIGLGTSTLTSQTTGQGNIAIGISSSVFTSSGGFNVGVGTSTLAFNRSGNNNTALGRGAGATGTKPITTGSNNTYVGYQAQSSDSTVSNETVIGASATGNGSNTVTIGNSSVVGNYFTGTINTPSAINSAGPTVTVIMSQATAIGYTGTVTNHDYALYSNNSEKVRIKAAGRVLFNTTTDNVIDIAQFNGSIDVSSKGKFAGRVHIGAGYIADTAGAGNNTGFQFGGSTIYPSNGAGGYASKDLGDGSARWGVYYGSNANLSALGTGAVYSNSGLLTNTDPSDSTIKNTITPHKYGLAEVLKLQPKSFYYNSDSTKASLKYGFIAQEVEKIMPDMVRKIDPKSDSSKLGLESQGIYVTMVKAIQEQQAIIEALLTRIKALEAKLN